MRFKMSIPVTGIICYLLFGIGASYALVVNLFDDPGFFGYAAIIGLSLGLLAWAWCVLIFIAGAYIFEEDGVTIKTFPDSKKVPYEKIKFAKICKATRLQAFMFGKIYVEIAAEKKPIHILVKDPENFLAELYSRCPHLAP